MSQTFGPEEVTNDLVKAKTDCKTNFFKNDGKKHQWFSKFDIFPK